MLARTNQRTYQESTHMMISKYLGNIVCISVLGFYFRPFNLSVIGLFVQCKSIFVRHHITSNTSTDDTNDNETLKPRPNDSPIVFRSVTLISV